MQISKFTSTIGLIISLHINLLKKQGLSVYDFIYHMKDYLQNHQVTVCLVIVHIIIYVEMGEQRNT